MNAPCGSTDRLAGCSLFTAARGASSTRQNDKTRECQGRGEVLPQHEQRHTNRVAARRPHGVPQLHGRRHNAAAPSSSPAWANFVLS